MESLTPEMDGSRDLEGRTRTKCLRAARELFRSYSICIRMGEAISYSELRKIDWLQGRGPACRFRGKPVKPFHQRQTYWRFEIVET